MESSRTMELSVNMKRFPLLLAFLLAVSTFAAAQTQTQTDAERRDADANEEPDADSDTHDAETHIRSSRW